MPIAPNVACAAKSPKLREEMNATGAQECLLPQLQPAELWRESGRWDTYTQAEGHYVRPHRQAKARVGLGPTHEEVITTIARDMIRSYRQLPFTSTKFKPSSGMKFDPGLA